MVINAMPCVYVCYRIRPLHNADELEAFLTNPEIAHFGVVMEKRGRQYNPRLDEPLPFVLEWEEIGQVAGVSLVPTTTARCP